MKLLYVLTIVVSLHTPLFAEELDIVSLQHALVNDNPRLKAFQSETEMIKHKIVQSSSLDDPKLKLGVNNLPADSFSFDREDMTSKEVGISQMFPLWGKLSTKERIMTLKFQKSLERLRLERVESLHLLRVNVYQLIAAREKMQIFKQIKKDLRMVIESQKALLKTGTGNIGGLASANMESLLTEQEIIILEQQESESLQKINYLVGRNVSVDVANADPVHVTVVNESKGQLLDESPAIKILQYEKQIDEERIKLKKLEYLPDMEVGVSYMQRDDGPMKERSDMVSGMISFNIPLWIGAKDAMVHESNEKYNSTKRSIEDKKNELKARADVLRHEMDKWEKISSLYKNQLLPQAELSFKGALADYRTSGGLSTVIDRERQLLNYKKELVTAKMGYRIAYSELASITGIEVLQ